MRIYILTCVELLPAGDDLMLRKNFLTEAGACRAGDTFLHDHGGATRSWRRRGCGSRLLSHGDAALAEIMEVQL